MEMRGGPRSRAELKVTVAVTGASGAPIARRLLEILRERGIEVHLILSRWGKEIAEVELEEGVSSLTSLAHVVYDNEDLTAPPSSGTFGFDGMIVVPCSAHTLAKVALGMADDLISRVASVALKEGRKLILVVREAPLSLSMVENMLKAISAGAVVLPAVLTFYYGPKRVEDLIDYVVLKVMDQLGLREDSPLRWRRRTPP